MKNTVVSIFIIGIFVCSFLMGIFVFFSEDTTVLAITITVDDDGPADYSKIQDAINASSDGVTIYVYSGTYYENVVVNKSINLTGEDRKTTVIDGGGSGDVVRFTADWVNITGFTIANGSNGIYLPSSSNNSIIGNVISNNENGIYLRWFSNETNITGNNVSNNEYGIFLYKSHRNNITGNNVSNNVRGIYLWSHWNNVTGNNISDNEYGVYLEISNGNNIKGNNILDNDYGIYLKYSQENNITKNTMIENGIFIWGSSVEHWATHNINISNTVNGNPLYYWKNRTGGIIPSDAGQVILANCTNINIQNLELTNGTVGIELGFSSENNITGNNIFNNSMYGIYLAYSHLNNISSNNASHNKYGLRLYSSSGNNITGNDAFKNDFGIVLAYSSNDNINNNSMIENGFFIDGDSLMHWNTHNIDSSNTVNGKPVRFWKNQTGGTIPLNTGQVILANCTNVSVTNLKLSGSSVGIELAFSDNNNITFNNASNMWYGIYFYQSDRNDIKGNNVSNNEYGIYLKSSSWNNITVTNISNNEYGLYLYANIYNRIYHNNIIDNSNQAYDSQFGNYWDNGYPWGGNYWSDWITPDVDNDGFVDNPRPIDGWPNQDNWPLAKKSGWNRVKNLNTGVWYVTIQTAINNASLGDTLWASAGKYNENVVINRTLNLTGENKNNTIIDGGGSGDVVYVNASWVNVSGFTVRNSGNTGFPNYDAGIELNNIQNCRLINNNVSNNREGIYLWYSSGNNITGNTALNNLVGIRLDSSTKNNITDNTVQNNDMGILLEFSSGNNVTHNNASDNDQGIRLYYSKGNNITGNNASSNLGGIYLLDSSGNNITDNEIIANDERGIDFYSSDGNNITGNNISLNTWQGIYLWSSPNNTISNNNISSNSGYGIYLREYSNRNNITNNTISSNNQGIHIESSNETSINYNNVSNNAEGIYLWVSIENNISRNYIFDNYNGISFIDSDINSISSNNISSNSGVGIYIYSSIGINILNNNASLNGLDGIQLRYSEYNTIMDNILFLNTGSGIRIDDDSNYNDIISNNAMNNYHGIWVMDSSDGNKITSNTASDNERGISLLYSDGNNITSNTASSNSDDGIVLLYSNGNNITGNNASSNSDDGFYLGSSDGNSITGNNVSSNNWEGIYLDFSHGNNITGNNASNNGNRGIYLHDSIGNSIRGNNVSSNGFHGIRLTSSLNNNITDNSVLSNIYGIYLNVYSSGNYIVGNTVSNNDYGIFLSQLSSNNMINNCNIFSNNLDGIWAEEDSKDNVVINSTILNSGPYDFYLSGNASIIALNTTFDKSKVYFDDQNSTFTVKWFMHVYVVSTGGFPISNASVEVANITGDPVKNSPFITEDDGFVRWIVVTEYIQNDTNGGSPGGDNKIYSTPHNVTAYLMGNTGYAEPEPVMDSSKVITIILDTEKPIADAGIDVSVDEDEPYTFDGNGSFDNIAIANWTWDYSDGTFGYGMTPTHIYISSGFYVVVLNVTDTAGNWDTDTVNIFVNNVQPIADAGNDKVGDEGKQITFDGSNSIDTASDINSLVYIWDFDDGTFGSGKIVNHRYEDNGTFIVTLQVTDDDGTSSTDSITVTINNTAPKITPVPPQFLLEDQIYTLQVIPTDVKGDTLTFSDNTTMFDIDPITGIISFTPQNADVGTHLVNITVADDDGAESYLEIQFTIQNTNDAPIITSSPITIAVENSTYYYNLTVMDDDMDTLIYTLDLRPGGMSIDPNGRITWIPTYQQASQTFMVIVNVSDGSDFVTQTFSIIVMNVNDKPTITSTPVLTVTEDVIYTYDVDAVDIDIGDWLIYSLDTAPIGMSIDSSTGLITWVPTNDQIGVNYVVVNVTDSMGAFTTQEFSIIVSNANDAPVLGPIGPLIATEDQPFYYQAVATDIDLYDTLSFYNDYELFQIDEDTGIISFMPLNDDVGTYTLKIMVQDAEGAMDNETIIFMVLNVNDSPTLDFINDWELTEDLPFTLIVTASDIDSDDSITFLDNTTLFDINSYSGEISFTPTNEDVGTHLVNITVKDKSDGITYLIVTFIINNVNDPPLIEPIGGLTAMMGKAFNYTVMATDIDPGNILTFSDDTEIFIIDPNSGEISFTPSKKDAGVHYVTITVTDEEGETNQTTVTFTILEAEAEELFDYTGILLIIIVGLIAFFIGYFIRRKEERELPKEEEEGIEEPEEIEMELLEEEPEEEEKLEGLEKRPPSLPPEEEEPVEFELMEAEGIDSEESEASRSGQVGEAYL